MIFQLPQRCMSYKCVLGGAPDHLISHCTVLWKMQCFSWRWLPWPAHWNALPSSQTIINLYLLSVARGKLAMRNVSRIAFCTLEHSHACSAPRLLGWMYVQSDRFVREELKKQQKSISVETARMHAVRVLHTNTQRWLSALLEFFLHSEGELWVLSHADTVWAGTH